MLIVYNLIALRILIILSVINEEQKMAKKEVKKAWSKPKLTKIKVNLESVISASDMGY